MKKTLLGLLGVVLMTVLGLVGYFGFDNITDFLGKFNIPNYTCVEGERVDDKLIEDVALHSKYLKTFYADGQNDLYSYDNHTINYYKRCRPGRWGCDSPIWKRYKCN